MADAVAVDTWDAEGVRLSDVVEALADLRHQSMSRSRGPHGGHDPRRGRPATTSRPTPPPAPSACLGRHHPARIVLLRPDPDQVATLDGRAALYAVEDDGSPDQLRGGHRSSSAARPPTTWTRWSRRSPCRTCPSPVWYVGAVPEPTDPLLSVATAVLLDSRDAADTGRLRSLLELARRRTVVDLSWIRLAPWRELLAGAVRAAPIAVPGCEAVERVEVTRQDRPPSAARRMAGRPAPAVAPTRSPRSTPGTWRSGWCAGWATEAATFEVGRGDHRQRGRHGSRRADSRRSRSPGALAGRTPSRPPCRWR